MELRLSSSLICALACLAACGGTAHPPTEKSSGTGGTLPGSGPSGASPTTTTAAAPQSPIFQVAFASTLQYPHESDQVTTFRIPVRLGRTGQALRVAFWGNESPLHVVEAWFGVWHGYGEVTENQRLLFNGEGAADAAAGKLLISDSLAYSVTANTYYVVSVAAHGGTPEAQGIGNNGVATAGNAAALARIDGENEAAPRVVKWVSVEALPQRAVALLGDSIGNGAFALSRDDRLTVVAQAKLGFPVVDASSGGDGIERALARIDRDVVALPGITDCVVQVGTNDLHREDTKFLVDNLSLAYKQLRAGGVRPWAGTIMPKGTGELTFGGERTRQDVNAFMKSTPLVEGVVDFATALADPNDPTRPAADLIATDGIHPNNAGQHAMGDALVKAFQLRTDDKP